MSFPKFVKMTRNTHFFSNFAHFCTPKRCTYTVWPLKTTLITWFFLRGGYPTWKTSPPPPGLNVLSLHVPLVYQQTHFNRTHYIITFVPLGLYCCSKFWFQWSTCRRQSERLNLWQRNGCQCKMIPRLSDRKRMLCCENQAARPRPNEWFL